MLKVTYTNTNGESVVLGNDKPYILTEVEGFDSPENIISSESNYSMDGESFISQKLAVRNITLTGYAVGKDKVDFLMIRKNAISIFNPKLAGTIKYENEHGTYSIDVIPEMPPTFQIGNKTGQPYQITLKALDPYWTDKSEIDAEIPMARIEPMLTFPLEITPDFEFAHLIAGDVIEIHNNGDVAVGAVFAINVGGPLVNPRLYNVLTQEYFALNGTFMTGTKLRISTLRGKKRVEQDDGDGWYNIMTKRKVESKFLQLEKGINYLQLQADSGVAFTTSYIKFEPKILGV